MDVRYRFADTHLRLILLPFECLLRSSGLMFGKLNIAQIVASKIPGDNNINLL